MLYLDYSKNSTKRLAMRKIKFQTDNYYHIFNRGVDKRNIFLDKNDYLRFLISLREFNNINPIESIYRLKQLKDKEAKLLQKHSFCSSLASKKIPLVKIICYSLLPNHFHLLVQQSINEGITKFMHKLGYGYTRYFNNKHNRSGSLFQGTFKAVEIKSDGQLQKVSCYINGNSEIHNITKATSWPWSSYMDYLNLRKGNLCNKNIVLDQFKNTKEYEKLTNIIINDSKQQKNEFKKFLLE